MIYDLEKNTNTNNTKFITVIFSPQQADYIPTELRGFNRYLLDTENLNLDSNKQYEALYRHLTNQPENEKPELGKLQSLPPRQHRQWQGNYSSKEQFEVTPQARLKDKDIYGQAQAREKLSPIQEKLEREKWLSIIIIIGVWVIPNLILSNKTTSASISGFLSGFFFWLVSPRTEQSKPLEQAGYLFLYMLIGASIGFLIETKLVPQYYSISDSIVVFMGTIISIVVVVFFWQIRR